MILKFQIILAEQSCLQKSIDGYAHSDLLSKTIKNDLEEASPSHPLIVIKHHLFTNFSIFGLEEPSWINVAREPVSRFVSSYYFRRFGFNAHQGIRKKSYEKIQSGERIIEMSLEDCIMTEAPECSDYANQAFLKYLCGSPAIWPDCATIVKANRAQALERAKKHVINNYFVIGILEDFKNTLQLFEKMLPEIFRGAPMIYEKIGEQIQNQTSTAKKETISDEARRKLATGPLRYQVDLYNLIKSLFKQKLIKYGMRK